MSKLFKSSGCNPAAGWLLLVVLGIGATGVRAGWPPVPSGYNPPSATSAVSTNRPPWVPAEPLTVAVALRRAVLCDNNIASLKAAVEVAREQRRAASDFQDPILGLASRTYIRGESVASEDLDAESRLSVEFPVPNPWIIFPRVNARTADYEAAKAELEAAIWQVRCEVQKLFAQLDFLTNDLAFNADRVRLNGEVLSAMQARLKQGAATASELMGASRQYIQFQNELDQTSQSYQMARRQLAALLDIPPGSFELALNAVTPPPEADLGFDEAEALADRSRYDLAALRWRAQAAESTFHEIRNERVPWLKDIQGGYLTKSEAYWGGLAVNVPIFTWTINHAADAARAKANLASVGVTNGLALIRQELHDAVDQVDQTRREAARNDLNVKPLIANMRQALASLKNTPNVMPEQVAEAELQLVETLRFDLETHWQYQLSLFNLEQTLGVPLSRQKDPGPVSAPRTAK